MNLDLLRDNYLVVPNFISKKEALKLKTEFEITDEVFEFSGDEQAPNSSSIYNYLPALELLANKTSHVSELIGETVLPTYVYSRIYRNGSELVKHTDRPACEISLTLHLGGDKPWAIWIKTPNHKNKCVNLNPGDAMLYLGCIAPHWRDTFEGNNYTQFFLHYVRSRGCCNSAYFDRSDEENDNSSLTNKLNYFLKKEYEEMGRVITPRKWKEFNQCEDNDENDFEIVEPDSESQYIEFDDSKSKIFSKQEEPKIEPKSEEYFDFDEVVIINKKYEKNFVEQKSFKPEEKNKKLSTKSLNEFILHFENWIEPDFCDELLDEYADTNLWEPTLTGSGYDPDSRKCNAINISDDHIKNETNVEARHELDEYLFTRVSDLIQRYQFVHDDFLLEMQEDTGYELLKYEVGDFFLEHSDSFKENPRALTIIFALNDNYEGGEIGFFKRELIYKLNVGDAIIFPSNFMYPHEILPITKGTRFSVITWVV